MISHHHSGITAFFDNMFVLVASLRLVKYAYFCSQMIEVTGTNK